MEKSLIEEMLIVKKELLKVTQDKEVIWGS